MGAVVFAEASIEIIRGTDVETARRLALQNVQGRW